MLNCANKLRLLVVFCFYSLIVFGQDNTSDYVLKPARDYSKKPAKTALFIELGGNAGIYSLNAERVYCYTNKLKLSGRAGFSPWFSGIYVEQNYIVEHNMILLQNPHHFEVGIGITLQRRFNELPEQHDKFEWENLWFPIARLGYRYQKQDEGFFTKIAFTPAITSKDALGFHPNYFQLWLGVGVGISF